MTGLFVVNADGAAPLVPLFDGMVLNPKTLSVPQISVRAEVAGKVKSVSFVSPARDKPHVEENAPYVILGDHGGKCFAWNPAPGEQTITVTPYSEPGARGEAGTPLTVRFTIAGDGDAIILSAADGKPHGTEIKHQGGAEKIIAFSRNTDDSVEWQADVPRAGLFRVELTYACDARDGGGEYELKISDHRFTGTSVPTGGWERYVTVKVGELTLGPGRVTVTMKPTALKDRRALMHLKSVRLVRAR